MKNFWVLALVLAAGCATGSHVLTSTGTNHPPIPWSAVKIYTAMPTNAVSIGAVNADNSWVYTQHGMDSVTKRIKQEAASIGANGIVITSQKNSAITGSSLAGTAVFVPKLQK